MNLFARNTSRERINQAQSSEPHVARRAVRYAAADNAQAALQRQFPGVSFIPAQQQPAAAQPAGQQPTYQQVGVQTDDTAQVA